MSQPRVISGLLKKKLTQFVQFALFNPSKRLGKHGFEKNTFILF